MKSKKLVQDSPTPHGRANARGNPGRQSDGGLPSTELLPWHLCLNSRTRDFICELCEHIIPHAVYCTGLEIETGDAVEKPKSEAG